MRVEPEDFQVVEELGWLPSGDGEHDFLFVEKTDANTDWVARQLAQHAGVPAKDVGFSGLKDRHAVTQQWFSVPRWHSPDWGGLAVEGVRVLEVQRHLRKLRRGVHQHNSFRIQLRDCHPLSSVVLDERLRIISVRGVPNYYGEQRFGRNGANLDLVESWARGRRLSRQKRSLAISTLRSFIFNQHLCNRVENRNWDTLQSGDKANLDGSASLFEFERIDAELADRCAAMDIHPSALLVGEGADIKPAHWQSALDKARVKSGDRSLRLRVADLDAETADNTVVLSFSLPRGGFATSVLREICSWR
jgi:tRNA pseudouridine13 synthase